MTGDAVSKQGRTMLSPLFTWRSAIADSSLSPNARLVALTLSLHMNERGASAYPSVDLLVAETGLSKRAVQEARALLLKTGYLQRVAGEHGGRRAGGGGVTATYVATLPPATKKGAPHAPHGTENGASDAPLRVRQTTKKGAPPAPEDVREESVRDNAFGVRADEVTLSPNQTSAQRLVGLYVDECKARGATPPQRTIGHEAREIGSLLAEGFAEKTITAAIRRQVEKGLSPATLASVMVDVQQKQKPDVPAIEGRLRAYDTA